jgi:hypothetical protein
MNWKEMLKPDWRKIVIFVIILLITPLPGFWSNMDISLYNQKCPKCPLPTPLSGEMDSNIMKMLINSDEFYNVKSFYYDIRGEPFYFITLLIIFYIISCFIICVYDKIKKKRIR